MALSQEAIGQAIRELAMLHKYRKLNPKSEEGVFLMETFHRVLSPHFSDQLFWAAFDVVLEDCTYFPQPGDFMKARDRALQVISQRRSTQHQLQSREKQLQIEAATDFTDDEARLSAKKFNILMDVAMNKISQKDAEDKFKKLDGSRIQWERP